MAVMQGTFVQKYVNIKTHDEEVVDITGWEFRSELRKVPHSATVLAELTTANGGFVTIDGPNGRLAFVLDETLTILLPIGRIYFDVLYENAPAGPVWLFGGTFFVRQPVTR